MGEARQEPLGREQGGQSQQDGSAAQGLRVGGEAAGAGASSTAGLVANGADDLLQASRQEHVRQWNEVIRPAMRHLHVSQLLSRIRAMLTWLIR